MRKVGILTHPLKHNYGGLLQAYALQTVLQRMGCEVEIINREYILPQSTLSRIKSAVRVLLGRNSDKYLRSFIKRNYRQTSPYLSTLDLINNATDCYDIIVVGSDQVWRPQYSPCIYNYFLDFTKGKKIKRIAYAASFGVDTWEYTDEETTVCSKLAKRFDAISVRELSGIQLCSEHLGVDAHQVLDPTMLLDKNDYVNLVNSSNSVKSAGNLFCYILDKDNSKNEFVNKIASSMQLNPYYCMPSEVQPFYPKVTQWIRSFMDAKMVITDSFHGTVFSILFNKPFWVLGNTKRGMTRFSALLNIFELQSRLVLPGEEENLDVNASIDWNSVNSIIEAKGLESLHFLENALIS